MTDFKSELIAKILERLKSEYGTPKTRDNRNTLQNLRCPVCGDPSAWVYLSGPWSVNCNKSNSCGISSKARDLFPDLFKRIEDSCPPVPEDPERPARAYLESRGLRQALMGLDFAYWKNVRGLPTGAVMFPIGQDRTGKTVFNGRLFDPPAGEGKTHNAGSTSGLFWRHPGRRLDFDKPVYVVEGIIDSLSLTEAGFQSIAVLSAGQDVSKLRLDGFKQIVTAFDHDRAGITATRKWLKALRGKPGISISSVFPDPGEDWNGILQGLHGGNARDFFEKKMSDYEFNGRLVLAVDAQSYVDDFLDFRGYSPGLFEFGGAYYFARPSQKGETYHAVRASDFTADVDFFQVDRTISDKPVYRYALTVKPQGKGRLPVKAVFDASELSTAQSLATSFLKSARCGWIGDNQSAKSFYSTIVQYPAREVRF